jgi:hypothetical protein
MHTRERMIRERFATRVCEHCGHVYASGNVLVLARRRPAWVVLVSCAYCDHRSIFVVSFPHADNADPERPHGWESPDISISDPYVNPRDAAQSEQLAPISADEVIQMREFLAHFDGDFKRAFSDPPSSPPSRGPGE